MLHFIYQERGVYGTFTNVDEYCIDLVPFDSDLLSMEMPLSFKVMFSPFFLNVAVISSANQ